MSGADLGAHAATSRGEQTSPRAPAAHRQHREPPHGVPDRAGQADPVEIVVAERREDGDRDDLGVRGRLHRGPHRAHAADRVHGEQVGPEPGHGARRPGHRGGDVIEFQVEKTLTLLAPRTDATASGP